MIKNIIKNKWFFRLIGIAIFIFILVYEINLKETLALFGHIKVFYLVLAILIMIIGSIIKPYRWQYILKTMNIRYSLLDVYKFYFIGLFMGLITPGRLGELGKIIYLKKDNHSLNQSLISVIIDRLADIFYLIVFGFIGFFFFLAFFKNLMIYTAIIIVLGVILLLLLIKARGIKNIFKKIILFFIPIKYKQKIEKSFSEFIENLKIYKFKNYFNIFILTIFSWLPSYIAVYFLANSMGITNISFFYLAVSITITSLVTMLPISVSGLGTREAAFLLLFTPLGFSPEIIIGFSLLIFITSFIITPVIGLSCWLITPLPVKEK